VPLAIRSESSLPGNTFRYHCLVLGQGCKQRAFAHLGCCGSTPAFGCANGGDMPDKNNQLSSVLCGIAGEYFVAAELSRRGFVASITLRNTRGIDVLATNTDVSRSVGIQVKTNQRPQAEWILNQKVESYYSDTLLYIFVNLRKPGQRPDFYIVPSKEVAAFAQADHAEWLSTPGRGGRTHVDNSVRKFRDAQNKYLERWELLPL